MRDVETGRREEGCPVRAGDGELGRGPLEPDAQDEERAKTERAKKRAEHGRAVSPTERREATVGKDAAPDQDECHRGPERLVDALGTRNPGEVEPRGDEGSKQ